jgi:hypothetical protein
MGYQSYGLRGLRLYTVMAMLPKGFFFLGLKFIVPSEGMGEEEGNGSNATQARNRKTRKDG